MGKPSSVLPARLRDARISAGMSQGDLEEAAGLSHRHVGAIEQGRRPDLTISVLAKLARALSVSADWLLGLHDTHEKCPCPKVKRR